MNPSIYNSEDLNVNCQVVFLKLKKKLKSSTYIFVHGIIIEEFV